MMLSRRRFLGGMGLLLLTARVGNASIDGEQLEAMGFPKEAVIPLRVEEQLTMFSCGLACLVSVLGYWGKAMRQGELLDAHPPGNEHTGYTMGELKAIAEAKAAKAFCLQGDFEFLRKQTGKGRPLITPLLIPYNEFGFELTRRLGRRFVGAYSHFVAVCAIEGGKVLFMNPLQGLQVVQESRFVEMWEQKQRSMLLVTA